MSLPVLVVGAAGAVGRNVVAGLLARGICVRGASGDPERHLTSRESSGAFSGAQLDLQRPETFAAALRGVGRVLLIARRGDVAAHRLAVPFVDAARTAGVRHIVNITALGVERVDDFPLRIVEQCVEDSGIPFTHLRPNWLMQVFTTGPLAVQFQTTNTLRLPVAAARVSYVDARDVAAVAVAALSEAGHEGRAYTLTGPESLDHDTVVRTIAVASGRPIRYVPVDESEARAVMERGGLDAGRAESLIRCYRLVHAGMCDVVTDTISSITHRPALSFRQFAADAAIAWLRPNEFASGAPAPGRPSLQHTE